MLLVAKYRFAVKTLLADKMVSALGYWFTAMFPIEDEIKREIYTPKHHLIFVFAPKHIYMHLSYLA